jgi:site-specific DNA-methyltransferase (adenine-specific)
MSARESTKRRGGAREKIRVPADFVRNPKATGAGRDGTEGATRPWIEQAMERGYHEKDGDAPVTDDAKTWQGWGTALKPAWEPIVLARKPLIGTVAANVLTHGTGAINVDGCRVPSDDDLRAGAGILPMRHHPEIPRGRVGEPSHNQRYSERGGTNFAALPGPRGGDVKGRFPANIIHDGSEEVIAAFPDSGKSSGGGLKTSAGLPDSRASGHFYDGDVGFGDSGSAARFFYSAKADAADRLGSKHPTVKPVDLMAYLCRLITQPGGTVLDPFAGSGSTGMACLREGFDAVLIEREEKFVADIKRRIAHVSGEDAPLFAGTLSDTPPQERRGRRIYGVFADEKSGRSE